MHPVNAVLAVNLVRSYPLDLINNHQFSATHLANLIPTPIGTLTSLFVSTVLVHSGLQGMVQRGNRWNSAFSLLMGVAPHANSMVSLASHINGPSTECIKKVAQNEFYQKDRCILPFLPKKQADSIYLAKMVEVSPPMCSTRASEQVQAMEACTSKTKNFFNASRSWGMYGAHRNPEQVSRDLIASECTLFGRTWEIPTIRTGNAEIDNSLLFLKYTLKSMVEG